MTANTTLYLTAEESAAFSSLPESLREGWTVEAEEGTEYEDADVLKIRAGMARFATFPELNTYIRESLKKGALELPPIDVIPESALPELFFTIGARGVAMLMKILLDECTNDTDVEGLAGLSHIRRDILTTNASISYA